VFQYDIAATANQQRRRFALEAMPLWLVEGMAEYFSKGRVDPLTSMWIRDATIHDRLPDLRKLTRDQRYFPYRYGQALMAYIGARFGDEAVVRYFLASGVVGVEDGVERALGISHKQLFADWAESSRELYNPVVQGRTVDLGTPLVGKKPAPVEKDKKRRRGQSELNVGPALSPDGRYLAFLSARELFSIDLYLADAKTGKVVRKLVSSDRDPHFESLRFIEGAGAWSPDSRKLAFVTFAKGDNYLSIVDIEGRGNTEHIKVGGLEAINNVAWSPDGRTIAIAGQTTGVSDLFLYDLESKEVRRLTSDKFADLQPAWSPDGKTLAFVTDRGASTVVEQLVFTDLRLATIDVSSGQVREIEAFRGARHINPQWSSDGQWIYFIANPEGIPDVYRINVADGHLERITQVNTGVAGITDTSPALTVAQRTGDIALSLFEDDNYNIYALPANASGPAITAGAAPGENQAPRAALLPPLRGTGSEITGYLMRPEEGLPPASTRFTEKAYDPDLRLAYLGPPTLGVGVSSEFGAGAGGSVSAFFSDILGQHNVGFTFAGGGGSGTQSLSEQLGGELFYLNQKRRLNWGADVMHIPYVAAQVRFRPDVPVVIDGNTVIADLYEQFRQVQTISDVSGLAQYPFSTTRRIEAAVGAQRYHYKEEVETWVVIGGDIIDRFTDTLGSTTINLTKASTAFVGDSSTFGFISPINGTRYRYEVEALRGDFDFQTALADWRKYFFFRPVTVAVRGFHFGRYGDGAEDPRIRALYVGQGSIGRGYDPYSIDAIECEAPVGSNTCPVFDRLIGSKIAAASLEVRAPLLGTGGYGLIDAPFLPTEIFGFADAAAAWSKDDSLKIKYATRTNERVPVFSVGVGLRILLSYIPIEIFAAKPFQRPDEEMVYGFNIIPGW